MATMKLRAPGLTGEADAQRAEAALHGLAGVYGAVVSPMEHCIEIDFEDDEVTADQILEALRHAGVEARLAG
jgi:copper chaperone CopZ